MKRLLTVILLSVFGTAIWATNPPPPTVVHLGTVPQVEVSGLEDMRLLELDPTVPNIVYTANENLCIYTSAADRNYNVTVESQTGNQYQLNNGTAHVVVSLWWSPQAATEEAEELTPNEPLTVENSSASSELNCPNGANANLQLRIASDQLIHLPQGMYSGVFNVIITSGA